MYHKKHPKNRSKIDSVCVCACVHASWRGDGPSVYPEVGCILWLEASIVSVVVDVVMLLLMLLMILTICCHI